MQKSRRVRLSKNFVNWSGDLQMTYDLSKTWLELWCAYEHEGIILRRFS